MSRLRMAAARTPTLTIGGSPTLTATQDSAYAGFTPTTSGGSGGNTFSMVGTALPAGLSMNSSTGAVTGTPTGSGTVSGIIQRVTDSFGHTADLSWGDLVVTAAGYNDGLSGAPSGSAQYPTYLNNNAGTNALGVAIPNRPSSWNVPGVDYPTGTPSGQVFKDITNSADRAAYLPSNVTYDSANDRLIMGPGGAAIVLDGWDLKYFSLYSDGGAPAVTVKNSKWTGSAGHDVAFVRYHYNESGGTDGPLLIQYCEIDGNYVTGSSISEVIKGGGGGVIVEYCNVVNVFQDFINAYSKSGCPYFIFRYSSVVNSGDAVKSDAWLGHCDVFQTLNPSSGSGTQTGDWDGIEIYGIFVVQPTADGSNYPVAMNSFVRFGDMDGKNINNPKIHHCVVIGLGANHQFNNGGSQAYNGSAFLNVFQWNTVGPTEADGDFIKDLECHDIYYFSDDSGRNATDRCANGYFYQGSSPGISYTLSNNVKMWDGTTFSNTLPGH